MATYVHTLDAMWVEIFFYSGLGLAAVGQIAAYLGGERTTMRRAGMLIGIAAVVLMFVAGKIASEKLHAYVVTMTAPGGAL